MDPELRAAVVAGYEAMSSGDPERMIALCDPQVAFQSRITAVEEVTYRGPEGVRRFFARLREVFEWFEVEPTEIEGEDGRAVAVAYFRARGRGSGAEVEQVFFHAMRVSGGKAQWWAFFDSRAEARAAVGLDS